MVLCLLSALLGALLSLFAPVVQFGLGLLVTTAAGAALAAACGTPGLRVVLWAAAFFACAQVGYGCGIGISVLWRARRQGAVPKRAVKPTGSLQKSP